MMAADRLCLWPFEGEVKMSTMVPLEDKVDALELIPECDVCSLLHSSLLMTGQPG